MLLINRDDQTEISENMFLIKINVPEQLFLSFLFFSEELSIIEKKSNRDALLRKEFFLTATWFSAKPLSIMVSTAV